MKFIIIITVLFSSAAMSCSESKTLSDNKGSKQIATEKVTKQESDKRTMGEDKAILGTWQWVKTDCCGRINNTTFAKEEEPKRIIEFKKSGIARYFERGEMNKMAEQKFTFGTLGTQTTIKIGEYQPAIYTIKDDELVISWGYMDLQTEYYKRVKY